MKANTNRKHEKYPPILEGIPHWPVYRLSKNKKEFLEEVFQESIARIKELRPTRGQLIDEIEATIYREQNRMKRNKWRVDPADEKTFWNKIKRDLIELNTEKNNGTAKEDEILRNIVRRYAGEIAGNFKPSSYRFARSVVKFWFARLLNGSQGKKFGAMFRSKYTLQDKIYAVGKVDMLRKLAQRGTVVMLPTHFSNLDSIVISWIIHSLGLPPFIYGAGINLFNIRILAYFMNSLGAYKVDRRKKNLFYIETLKMYSGLALQHGAHSLFFPGGTRSRSGAIETQLQLGLLSTTIEAQRNILMKKGGKPGEGSFQKIFIVPVAFNYHFVLEAPDIIHDYLHKKGQDRYIPEHDKYGSFQLLKFLVKFFTKGSNISVSIGRGMDVLGNYVDSEGNSLDTQGRVISVADYFVSNGKMSIDRQRTKEYTRLLSQRIIAEYHAIVYIYASHLVAFAAFKLWQKKHPKLDLFDLLRMPEEEMSLDYEAFKKTIKKLRKQVFLLEEQKKVNCADHVKGELDKVIQYGINNVGIFHLNRPLLKNKKNQIVTRDLTTLYYYHNRLTNYGLEQFI